MSTCLFDYFQLPSIHMYIIKDRKIQNGFSWSSFLLNLKKDMHLQLNIYQQFPHEFLPLHRYFFFFRT